MSYFHDVLHKRFGRLFLFVGYYELHLKKKKKKTSDEQKKKKNRGRATDLSGELARYDTEMDLIDVCTERR